jgi:ABC-type transporter MlaC component
MNWPSTLPALSLALALLAASPAPAADADAVEQARASVTSLFTSLATTAQDAAIPPDQKRALLERELQDHLDLHTLSSAAVGPLAERFSPEQLVDFSREYERYLVGFFLKQVAGSDGKGPQVSEARLDEKSGAVLVRALGRERHPLTPGRVAAPREAARPIPWDLALRQRRGRWQIVSVRINGVDVSQNFRAQLRAVLDRSDPDAVITELRNRNLADEAQNPFQE